MELQTEERLSVIRRGSCHDPGAGQEGMVLVTEKGREKGDAQKLRDGLTF